MKRQEQGVKETMGKENYISKEDFRDKEKKRRRNVEKAGGEERVIESKEETIGEMGNGEMDLRIY